MQRKTLLGTAAGLGALYLLGTARGKDLRHSISVAISGALPQTSNPILQLAADQLTQRVVDGLIPDEDEDPGDPVPAPRVRRAKKAAPEVTVINGTPVRIRDAEFTPIKTTKAKA